MKIRNKLKEKPIIHKSLNAEANSPLGAGITILNKHQLQITIERLACQVIENYMDLSSVVLIGLQPRGIFLADKIFNQLKKIKPEQHFSYGKLDITFYRDDIRNELHVANQTDISFSLEDKNVILIDDVLYTGRTIRAALDALLSFGRPKKVELCVLINRRYSRELPIQPDYCGKSIDSIISQKVKVEWDKEEVNLY
ncbi:MAG: bifunctional pyr operon transcriptional regulator/uracil phosphoribosyltransferase PyrR [Ginsengibacter sp.]